MQVLVSAICVCPVGHLGGDTQLLLPVTWVCPFGQVVWTGGAMQVLVSAICVCPVGHLGGVTQLLLPAA
jgi:hypothetical protein